MTDNPFYKKADELTDLMNRLDYAGKSDLADDIMESINSLIEKGNEFQKVLEDLSNVGKE